MSDHSEHRDPWEIFTPLPDEERAAKLDRMRKKLANAENDERDAARYRWLREQVAALEISVEWCVGSYSLSPNTADELDAAIDAAKEPK